MLHFTMLTLIALLTALVLGQSSLGVVEGVVTDCVAGPELPVYYAAVTTEEFDLQVRTDLNGKFTLLLPPGTYTIVATDTNGTATRRYVPVDSGETIDVGTLDIGPALTGCDLDVSP